MAEPPAVLSQRAFARELGVSHTAVQKAIKSGRLEKALVRRADGRIRGVNLEVGRAEWTESTDPSLQREPKPGDAKPGRPAGARREKGGADQEAGLETGGQDGPSYQKARRYREAYRAQLTRLDLEERLAKVVDRGDATADFFALGRAIRDALEGLPGKLRDRLAAETVPNKVAKLLAEGIREALEGLQELPVSLRDKGEGPRLRG